MAGCSATPVTRFVGVQALDERAPKQGGADEEGDLAIVESTVDADMGDWDDRDGDGGGDGGGDGYEGREPNNAVEVADRETGAAAEEAAGADAEDVAGANAEVVTGADTERALGEDDDMEFLQGWLQDPRRSPPGCNELSKAGLQQALALDVAPHGHACPYRKARPCA